MTFLLILQARQPQKMIKHTQTFRRLLSVFNHFLGLALKGLI